MSIEQHFPGMKISPQASMGEGFVTLQRGADYVHFPKKDLTERELALLVGLAKQEETPFEEDPWNRYLLQKDNPLPVIVTSYQLLYLEHAQKFPSELVELYQHLLPNLVAVTQVSASRTVLILDQTQSIDVHSLLEETLPTIEHDFGIGLTVFFGNRWQQKEEELGSSFMAENALFTEYLKQKGSERSISFARLLLWGLARQVEMTGLTRKILKWIEDSKDMEDTIQTMWATHGNLVQTAQTLFLHRNSLQYRLDKFLALTGLNLKNLDDLALCYLLGLKG